MPNAQTAFGAISVFLLSNVFQSALGFLKSLFLVRLLGVENYGLLLLTYSIVTLLDFPVSGLDTTILRFFRYKRTRTALLPLGVVVVKVLCFVIFGLFSFLTLGTKFDDDFKIILVILYFPTGITRALTYSLISLLNANESYTLTNRTVNIETLISSGASILLVLLCKEQKTAVVMIVILQFFTSYFTFKTLKKECNKKEVIFFPKNIIQLKIAVLTVTRYWRFFTPLTISNLSFYLKKHIPTYIFSINGNFHASTVYDLVTKVYEVSTKIIPAGMFQTMPTIHKRFFMYEKKDFFRKWLKYCLGYFGLMTLGGVFLFAVIPYFIKLYTAVPTNNLRLGLFFFNLQISLICLIHCTNSFVYLKKRTSVVLTSNILRNGILICLMYNFRDSLSITLMAGIVATSLLGMALVQTLWFFKKFRSFSDFNIKILGASFMQMGIFLLLYLSVNLYESGKAP